MWHPLERSSNSPNAPVDADMSWQCNLGRIAARRLRTGVPGGLGTRYHWYGAVPLRQHVCMFDALRLIEDLQDAVQRRDREQLWSAVSERMIWVMPLKDNARGKAEWIEASCGVTWNWFRVSIHREVDLGAVRVVEAWVEQSREPVEGEDASEPVAAEGVVVDVWADEDGTWRLVSRHPQRST